MLDEKNLTAQQLERIQELLKDYLAWEKSNPPPIYTGLDPVEEDWVERSRMFLVNDQKESENELSS